MRLVISVSITRCYTFVLLVLINIIALLSCNKPYFFFCFKGEFKPALGGEESEIQIILVRLQSKESENGSLECRLNVLVSYN